MKQWTGYCAILKCIPFFHPRNILLNYATAHPHYGYTQGMSDLLAPVLIEVQNEVDAYWCFVGLMQKTIFVTSPKDIDMDKQLVRIRHFAKVNVFKVNICSVCSASDFPTNVGFREICRISSDIEPFRVNWSDFGCDD